METIGCPEKQVLNQTTLLNNPEDGRSQCINDLIYGG
jgi:hypothetical protein